MKKYRLKKDTPALKAGMFFELKDGRLFLRESEDCVAIPVFQKDDITNFDEWFEEVKEFGGWEPEHGEKYKVMSDDGSVSLYCREDDDVDRFNFLIGNCYPLDTPDETIIKEQKLIPQALHRLRMAAKKAWFEFNGSEGPDWSDKNQEKYFIEFSHKSDGFYFYLNGSCQSLGQIYFPTEGSAEYVIDNMQDDLELLFGVE